MKLNDLRDKTDKELLKHLAEFKRELMNLRFQKISGEAVKPSRVRLLRTSVARVKTLLRQNLNYGKVNA